MNKDWRYIEFLTDIEVDKPAEVTEGSSVQQSTIIRGIAINATTTRNGHTFIANELEKSQFSLKGKPLLKNHSNDIDAIIGRVTNSYYDKSREALMFEAVVKVRKYADMVRAGLLTSVSVGAMVKDVEEQTDESGNVTGAVLKGIDFVELSMVAVPADPNAGFAAAVSAAFDKRKLLSLSQPQEPALESSRTEGSSTAPVSSQSPLAEEKIPMAEEKTTVEAPTNDALKQLTEMVAALQSQVQELKKPVPVAEEKQPETKGIVTAEAEEKADDTFAIERAEKGFALYIKDFSSTPYKKYQHSGNKISVALRGN